MDFFGVEPCHTRKMTKISGCGKLPYPLIFCQKLNKYTQELYWQKENETFYLWFSVGYAKKGRKGLSNFPN